MGAIQQIQSSFGPSGGAGASYDSVVATLSPWGYWKLLENPPTSGGSATDSSGNGRTATYSADTYTTGAGVWSNNARSPNFLAATTQAVAIPTFTAGGAMSIIIDWNPTVSTTQQIFSADTGVSRFWQLRQSGTGALDFIIILPSVVTISTVATYAINTAHKVIVVFDPTLAAGSGRIKIYADGALAASSTTAVTMTGGSSTPYLGWRGGGTEYFSGRLSGAIIINSAISAGDAAALWAARNTP